MAAESATGMPVAFERHSNPLGNKADGLQKISITSRPLYLVKGSINIDRVVEIGGKTHLVTPQGTLRVVECIHSNSFIAGDSSGAALIQRIYETVPVDLNFIYNTLTPFPLSRLEESHFTDFAQILTEPEYSRLIKDYRLLEMPGSAGHAVRVRDTDIVHIIKYRQSLTNHDRFALYSEKAALGIEQWAMRSFTGSSEELGYFILLKAIKSSSPCTYEAFLEEWRAADLYSPDVEALRSYIQRYPRDTDKMLAFLAQSSHP